MDPNALLPPLAMGWFMLPRLWLEAERACTRLGDLLSGIPIGGRNEEDIIELDPDFLLRPNAPTPFALTSDLALESLCVIVMS